MKIIFLDVDGVLNCSQTFIDRHKHWLLTGEHVIELDESKIQLLKQLVDASGANIVLSSTWRKGWIGNPTLKHHMTKHALELDKMLLKYDLHIMSKTPMSDDGKRGTEISDWLSIQQRIIDNYVILDDDTSDMLEHGEHIIETSFNNGGLLQEHIDKAIKVLSK